MIMNKIHILNVLLYKKNHFLNKITQKPL